MNGGCVADYDPGAIEPKWQKYWADNKTFKTGTPGDKKFYCLDFFPYPSGSGLHVGHPLGYIATDILSRYKRMRGYSVLHPMGWDAFGLPAEQHAINTGEHPSLITEKNCATFRSQMEKLGLSYDWDREFATCTADYYRWTQWIFLRLYNSWFDDVQQKARPIEELAIPSEVQAQGKLAVQAYRAEHRLAYYADAMVNWCPALGTVLANEEVINGRSERGGHEVVRKPMKQWMLRITKYSERLIEDLGLLNWPESVIEQQRNWIGRKYGAEIKFRIEGSDESLIAFTTRPDTLFGVTFFVVSPEHPLVSKVTTVEAETKVKKYCDEALKMSDLVRTIENRKKTGVFTGTFVVNPINQERIPLYIGDYVLMSVGTGAVMGVPAHDERDFEFARTFQLEIRPVLAPTEGDANFRTAVTEGEVAYTEPGPMLALEFPVARELALEGKPNAEAGALITAWLAAKGLGRKVTNYKLRDWLFSRQRYWGEPIPIVHWDDGEAEALTDMELPLVLPQVENYKPSESGESPLANAPEWVKIVDPKTGRTGRRETNTMPNWAGSCWYYLRFIDPKNPDAPWDRELEKKWMPVDLYVGGAEHAVLHLLYARFWHKVLYDLGYVTTKEPFQRLFNQGMILASAFKDKRGVLIPVDEVEEVGDGTAKHLKTGETLERITAKMSKSLRNVVTPDEIIAEFGADTLRMYEMFMGPLEASRVWDTKAISGNLRFLKKAWGFVTGNLDAGVRETVPRDAEPPAVYKAINRLTKRMTDDIEELHFNTCVSSMMEFLNEVSNSVVSRETLEAFVLLLAPFAPHTAEEMWERLGHKKSLAGHPWPSFDDSALKENVVTVVLQVNGKKRALMDVDVGISQDDLKAATIAKLDSTEYKVTANDQFIMVYQSGTTAPRLVNVLKKS
jgi:leucyl-tRNA synthetase